MHGVECSVPQGFRYEEYFVDHDDTPAVGQLLEHCFVVVGDLVCDVVFNETVQLDEVWVGCCLYDERFQVQHEIQFGQSNVVFLLLVAFVYSSTTVCSYVVYRCFFDRTVVVLLNGYCGKGSGFVCCHRFFGFVGDGRFGVSLVSFSRWRPSLFV